MPPAQAVASTGTAHAELPDLNTTFKDEEKVLPHVPAGSLMAAFTELRQEIDKHKWIESEKAGQDIGFEAALCDWMKNHRAGWRQAYMHRLHEKT